MKGGGCGIFDGIFKQFPCLFSRLDRSFVKDIYAFTSANHHTKRKYTQRPNHCLVEGGEKERAKNISTHPFSFRKKHSHFSSPQHFPDFRFVSSQQQQFKERQQREPDHDASEQRRAAADFSSSAKERN